MFDPISVDVFGVVLSVLTVENGETHRTTIPPSSLVYGMWMPTDISGMPDLVKSAAESAWTPDAVAQYQHDIERSSLLEATFAIPIGGGNQAPVPKSIWDRGREYASTEDFGISLYENDGVTVRDNQAALQDAIDKLQPKNATLFVPNFGSRFGSTVVETGPLTLRDTGTYDGKPYAGSGLAIVGINPGDRTSFQNGRFDLGQGLKLRTGSTGNLITSPANAGHLTVENLILSGNNLSYKGVSFENKSSGYGFGGYLRNVYINSFLQNGVYIGDNRGRGMSENLWIEYCGASTTFTGDGYAALHQGSYDWEHIGPQFGVNNGIGIYLGAVSQVRFIGGAVWMSQTGALISPDCDNVDFVAVHFDQHKQHGSMVQRYTGSTFRRGTRRFIGCRWSDNSDQTADTYSDIDLAANVDDTVFISPTFEGKGEAAPKQKYSVNLAAGAIFRTDVMSFDFGSKKPYSTAFTNAWDRIRFGGNDSAHFGFGNSGASLIVYSVGSASAEIRNTSSSLAGTFGAEGFRAEQISGGVYNRVVTQSTTNAFNFSIVKAESSAANAHLYLAGQGTGRVGVGSKTSASDAVSDGYVEVVDTVTGNIIRLMTRG